jgi:hypothetical protein
MARKHRERRGPVKVQLESRRSNQADKRLASHVERKAEGARLKDDQQDTAAQNEQISKPLENDSATPVNMRDVAIFLERKKRNKPPDHRQ